MKHQTPTTSGTLAHIRIAGVLHRRHFKKGTDPIKIKQWLLVTEMKYRGAAAKPTGRFEDDAAAYLASVQAMPTFTQRKQHIDAWTAVFQGQMRYLITSGEIRAQLHRWKASGLAAATVNKRRTALMHLYAVLDGKAERNPVKDAPKFAEPAPAPRGLPYAKLKALFAAMESSKSKARLMVVAYTGIPPGQVQQLTPGDVDLTAGTVAVPGRRKGAGTKGRIVPLTPDGVLAFRLMARETAWGRFGSAPLGRVLKRALKRLGLSSEFRVYDLRHTFGTEVYRRSGDIRATQLLMDHSTPTLTHRYTMAAQDPRVQAAVRKFR